AHRSHAAVPVPADREIGAPATPVPGRGGGIQTICPGLCSGVSSERRAHFSRKMPDPTKIATKAAGKVFSSADFCNSLWLAISATAMERVFTGLALEPLSATRL